jgi:hypothetical protein
MDLSIFNEYDNIFEVTNHRINEHGEYEYLVKLSTTLELKNSVHIESKEYENNIIVYNVWILDNFSMFEISISFIQQRPSFFIKLLKLFMAYRSSSNIRVMYCIMANFTLKSKKIEIINYLKTIYPTHQFVHNIHYVTTSKWDICKFLNKGDTIYCNRSEYLSISAYDLTVAKIKILHGLSVEQAIDIADRINYFPQNLIINDFKNHLGIDVIDNNYLEERKEKILAITSATHPRLGKDSILRVLQPHLLRDIIKYY